MSVESLSDKVQSENKSNGSGSVSVPTDKVQPENNSNDSGSVSVPMNKVQPRNNSDDSGSVPTPMDKVQPDNQSEDGVSVSMPIDKVQPNNQSEDSVSVSMPMDKIQNDVKVTDNANAEQESDEMDELFDDPPLDIFEYNLETEEHEWKHYVSDSDESNDTIPYDPKNGNWHDDLSTLDGSEIAFNHQSLTTRVNKLADALAKKLSEPSTSMPELSQSLQPASQKSSQGSSCNGSNVDDKDGGIGSLGLKESSAHSNNTIPQKCIQGYRKNWIGNLSCPTF